MWVVNCFLNDCLDFSVSLEVLKAPNAFEVAFHVINVALAKHSLQQDLVPESLLILFVTSQLKVD